MNAGYPWSYINQAVRLGLDRNLEDVRYTDTLTRAECAVILANALTADGRLKPCLHAKDEIFLRGLSGDALLETMQKAIYCKPAAHRMDALHPSSAGRNMFEIGG